MINLLCIVLIVDTSLKKISSNSTTICNHNSEYQLAIVQMSFYPVSWINEKILMRQVPFYLILKRYFPFKHRYRRNNGYSSCYVFGRKVSRNFIYPFLLVSNLCCYLYFRWKFTWKKKSKKYIHFLILVCTADCFCKYIVNCVRLWLRDHTHM